MEGEHLGGFRKDVEAFQDGEALLNISGNLVNTISRYIHICLELRSTGKHLSRNSMRDIFIGNLRERSSCSQAGLLLFDNLNE